MQRSVEASVTRRDMDRISKILNVKITGCLEKQ